MKVLGVDLGSRGVKMALFEDGVLKDKVSISTMSFYRDYCSFDGKVVVNFDKLNFGQIDIGVSTGYGRNNTDLKMFTPINEVKAHAYGALHQTSLKDFILLDIGGQDVKIVRIEKGIITDLELNEKCAASCGRYLENMALILEIGLDEMFKCYENPVELNSTCAVFSESELIGKIAEGSAIRELCAGVNYSLYKRLQPLLTKFRGSKLVLSGGVAHNLALINYLKKDYNEVIVIGDPQFNGAVGCCIYAERMILNEKH